MAGSEIPTRVHYGVDYSDLNPYQDLLRSAVGAGVAMQASPITAATAAQRCSSFPIVYHLHWEEHPLVTTPAGADPRLGAQRLLDELDDFLVAGGSLVWTRHNLEPHEAIFRPLHREIVPHLTAMASIIHLHSREALGAVVNAGQADLGKSVVIGHGTYGGRCPEWPAAAARNLLGIAPDHHVFLLFGRHAAYRGTAAAVEALVTQANPLVRILVVGEPGREGEPNLPADPRIQRIAERVADDKVGLYFAAADTVVLPYESCLTSGTAHLSFGLGRAVIGPDLPGLREIVSDGVTGRLYDAERPDALAEALAAAVREGRRVWSSRGAAAGRAALSRDWSTIGPLWRAIYSSLTRYRLPGRLDAARIAAP